MFGFQKCVERRWAIRRRARVIPDSKRALLGRTNINQMLSRVNVKAADPTRQHVGAMK